MSTTPSTTPSGAHITPSRCEVASIVDHTLLKPESTRDDINNLIQEAADLGAYSVCVSPSMLPVSVPEGLHVAAVCGFPSGAHASSIKANEARCAVDNGAEEIDMVINLAAACEGDWATVERDIRTVREAVPSPTVLKVILETALLSDDGIVAACIASQNAGADFVKTSTGFHPSGGASAHAIRLMRETVGPDMGVKASGGIRTAAKAIEMINAGANRLGLSGTRAILDELSSVPENGCGHLGGNNLGPDATVTHSQNEEQKILARASEWADNDVDTMDAATIRNLIAAHNVDELRSRFAGPLQFGTAGLRGEVGAGESRMNRSVVIKATAGLIAYLRASIGDAPVVVVGHDARHGSAVFATDAAEVIAAAGGHVIRVPSHLPTPLLAFAVRHLNADAGVMVTASHNPPRDNGYKVYLGGRMTDKWGHGVQIISPDDKNIADAIAQSGPAKDIPRSSEGISYVGEELRSAYIDAVEEATACFRTAPVVASTTGGQDIDHRSNDHTDDEARRRFHSDIAITLTALHGVGAETATRVLNKAGFTNVTLVREQAEPDPDFPTVAFPNPEEAGALDYALATARRTHADVVIALDPDADRCSVAIPTRSADSVSGGNEFTPSTYRRLTGDQIGALLGDFVARMSVQAQPSLRHQGSACDGGDAHPEAPVFASSIVSSRLLASIAARYGIDYTTTLTGFKWIGRTPQLAFGYEEAIGYCVYPEIVRDKDGVSAAVTVAYLVHSLREAGRTVEDRLTEIARDNNVYATAQAAFRVADHRLIADSMSALRATPPTEFAGSPVVELADLAEGYCGLPATEGVLFLTEDDTRVICRPSGTEPKLKCYLEVVLPVDDDASDADVTAVRMQAQAKLERVRAEITSAVGFPSPS
ncbi:deoxyribose-phosphate aldolase [Corynebacterium kroppenstedtii]